MLAAIISFSLRNKLVIGLFVAALIALGAWSFYRLPIDAVPDITNNQVQVVTLAPDLAAREIEQFITYPVEQVLATIPGKTEIRSISRSGLSVVTIVFTESTDLYWARQQVSERLTEVQEQIPSGSGRPEMAPVTTGLGEIYQYTIQPQPGYASRYSLTELRTIQDWIIRRQLRGTPGVADISSFGGNLKQYEVAVHPDRLRSMGISLDEVVKALEANNENTGGAYVEKGAGTWYIRSEGLLRNERDIASVTVHQTAGGLPVRIGDIGEVRIGKAIRYGALTRDTLGETVGGIVLMLKGANSAETIQHVKERIGEIKTSLPEGLEIVPYLDRSKLVNNAIRTVRNNLAEGALIVVFVLVLLLGNLRAGLIVASVIPLAMLFALCMMRVFGVSGNLMSLGAIDFGLIVDGAVIIVEAVVHTMQRYVAVNPAVPVMSREQLDATVKDSTGRMMKFAAFGQLIILIVYLPILSLTGIEGKMFRPMAETVSFAIIGALILSLTWVPVASSLFLKRKVSVKPNVSDRIIGAIRSRYLPLLTRALTRPLLMTGSAVALLAISLWLFSRMGGEFIPTLDEGDFAVEMRLMQGSSLSHTIETTHRAAEILMRRFPEVERVTGKIGTSEIPIDPMPPEACDLIISLKDRSEWTSASSREELANRMQEALEEQIPGVLFGFQQPIQMRFNELMTGARQDVVVKIYGEDLDSLAAISSRLVSVVERTHGAVDIYEEKLGGLPQLIVRPRRDRLARYGISVSEVNAVVNTAFAGQRAGLVFEGERRFDLVVRLPEELRNNLQSLGQLTVNDAKGNSIPLAELADIVTEPGAAQIQRDEARRRAIIGFNVRGSDVESVVKELQQAVSAQVKLPPGYSIRYGGQFTNLIEARGRLSIAVPVALLLIFMLLYFTFHSVKYALLIFTAVPFSVIGGITALWLRDMPFSISAGVGFIALFGVAVLNGIVLVGFFNQLRREGETDLKALILKGASERLRPILMTATVASLGFLPMALSTSAGAEVQKPLATVVIGGLISATLLTLFILPVLYMLFERKRGNTRRMPVVPLILLLLVLPVAGGAQTTKPLSLDEAVQAALTHHPRLKQAGLETAASKALETTAFDFGRLSAELMGGEYNSNYYDHNYTFTQSFPFPSTVAQQRSLNKGLTKVAGLTEQASRKEVVQQVSETWFRLYALREKLHLLQQQDSLFRRIEQAAGLRYRSGETGRMEELSAQNQRALITSRRMETEQDILAAEFALQLYTGSEQPVSVQTAPAAAKKPLPPAMHAQSWQQSPLLLSAQQGQENFRLRKTVERNRLLPELTIGYFNQSLMGYHLINGKETFFDRNRRFTGYIAGISVPLWFAPQTARIRSATLLEKAAVQQVALTEMNLRAAHQQALLELQKSVRLLEYYETSALQTAATALEQAHKAYETGESDYLSLAHIASQSFGVQQSWLDELLRYNLAVLRLEFLSE